MASTIFLGGAAAIFLIWGPTAIPLHAATNGAPSDTMMGGTMTGDTMTAAAPKPATTPAAPAAPEPEYMARYGKILRPNDHPPYLFKLTMPFPGFGEVKVPSKDELDMRAKLEQLATLSDDQIRDQLQKWPGFSKLSLTDEGAMLMRIQQFRDYRTRAAQARAQALGLLTLSAPQQAKFEKEFWDKQLQMDRALALQLDPQVKAAEQKVNESLFREFSAPPKMSISKPPNAAH